MVTVMAFMHPTGIHFFFLSGKKSDDVITLIDDVPDILAELVREEPDDGEDDETSEDTRTHIAYRHDHRVSEITTS